MRGKSCGILNVFSSDAGSASCLSFNTSPNYRGFTISAPRLTFTINVQVSMSDGISR